MENNKERNTEIMSEAEVCKSYREAKNKNKQIKILADLCLCEEQEIMDILVRNNQIPGIKAPDKKKKKRYNFTSEEARQIEQMYADKKPAGKIAEKLGLDELSVVNKIKRMGLPQKYGRGRTKTEKPQTGSDIDREYIKELERLLVEKDGELKAVKYENARLTADKLKSERGTTEVINDLGLFALLLASMKERLPADLLERTTERIECMTAFLCSEVS